MCWKPLTNGLLAALLATQVVFSQTQPLPTLPQPKPSAVQSLTGTDQYVRPSATVSSGPVLALDSVLTHIDQYNPLLKPFGSRAAAARAYAEGARSWMAPMVGVGTFMAPYPMQMIMDERDKGFGMVSVEQDIPNPFKQRATRIYQQSKAGVEEAGRGITLNRLRSDAKQLYFDWLVLEKRRGVLAENKRILQLMKKLADIRYPYQQGSLGNIYKAEGRLYELDNMVTMTEAEIERKRIGLNTLMNRPKTEPFQIDTTYRPAQPQPVVPTTEEIGGRRSDILRMDKQILSMQAGIESQKAQARPDFRIRFDHMQPFSGVKSMMPTQFTLMGMISIPIVPWASRMYKAEIKGMQQDIEAMRYEREGMLNETQGMVAEMLTDIRNMNIQLANYERRVIPTLRKNYDTQLINYEQNKGELPLVIDAWETLNMTQMDYLTRLQDYYRMIVSYERELEK
ncbi:Outer membrane protein-like protein (plasmid) [Spirosoma linguale DSM 74]|uniref:Outer membrane protein-like protein n=2 Tax=Cytophagaceae TaxID=89373 RepID=D2QVJ3_SPILD|nr:Outer membrane protein-like protein [Spirosoma linguale DSM 74]